MKVSPNEKGQSVRLLRIGEQVRHALAQVLLRGDLRDELLTNTIVSVSEVRVTADMRIATAYVKPLGDADEQAVIKALASHAKYLRGEIARQLATKYTPELRFRRDESFDAGARIDAILKRPGIARDLPPAAHVTTIAELEEEDRLLGLDHDDEAEDSAPDAVATETPATGANKA